MNVKIRTLLVLGVAMAVVGSWTASASADMRSDWCGGEPTAHRHFCGALGANAWRSTGLGHWKTSYARSSRTGSQYPITVQFRDSGDYALVQSKRTDGYAFVSADWSIPVRAFCGVGSLGNGISCYGTG